MPCGLHARATRSPNIRRGSCFRRTSRLTLQAMRFLCAAGTAVPVRSPTKTWNDGHRKKAAFAVRYPPHSNVLTYIPQPTEIKSETLVTGGHARGLSRRRQFPRCRIIFASPTK